MIKFLKNKKGVSLTEIMVVISIMIILAVAVVVRYSSFDDKAIRDSSLLSSNAFAKALRMYRLDKGGYPPSDVSVETILLPYMNVTNVRKTFTAVTVYVSLTPAVCIYGTLRDITPIYRTNLCVEYNETTPMTSANNQPACLWEGRHNWQACSLGM